MKKLIYVVLMMMVVVGCERLPRPTATPSQRGTTSPRPSPGGEGVALRMLENIDSLMWKQPDSAFAMLQEFVVSPEAIDLDEFNGHYCQLLISELLYKNYYGQSNREGLLHAVDYFDSLTEGIRGTDTRGVSLREQNAFIDSRAHYINGVGFYERGDMVNACSEYLKALELMEGFFEEQTLTGKRAQHMANTYNRIGDLFSEQFMMESAITCYENALFYCKIEPTSSIGVSNILYRIGKQYDKKNEAEIAQSYFSEALENMTVIDNMVYRDIVASKALCDYQINGIAKQSLDELNRVLFQAKTEKERLNRNLTIGCIFFYEDNYDSALYYLEPVFENHEAGLQDQAANYMYIIYNKQGDRDQADSLMHFLASRKKLDGENKALVSKLEDMFKAYTNQKQEKEAEEAREKSIRKTVKVIVPITIIIALTVFVVVKLRSKKLLKKQQEEADRILGETEQAHEKELRLWQAEADKTLEETKKRYEEELRQLKAETEQQLEEVERKHQQWMAEARERHDEELRTQKDRSEKEIEKTKKRHVKELEAERVAYEKEQDALRRNLKERESQVISLEKTLNLQQKAAKQRRMAFLKEPICQHILDEARSKQITTRNVAHELGIALKDKDFEQLGEAVEKHYEGFDHELLSQCPSLKQGLLSLCHMHLLGLNESEIAALKNLSYSAIKKQNESLQEKLGVDEDISSYILRVAEGLCGTQNGTQGGTQTNEFLDDDLDAWIERQIKDNPKITTEELAEKSHKGVRTIKRHISMMGHIHYVGSGYSGHWEVIE